MNSADTILIDDKTSLTPLFSDTFNVWKSVDRIGTYANASKFLLDTMPAKILPWSILADVIVQDGETDFRFRFWGTQRATLIGYDLTGKSMRDVQADHMREGNVREYQQLLELRAPLLCRTPIVTSTGRAISLTSIRLPLSDDGKQISRVFSALDPESVTSEHYAHFGTDPRQL